MLYPVLLKYRHRLPALLAVMMLLVIGSFLYMRHHFTSLNAHLDSIYEDRLVPASEIYSINTELYKRRLLLTDFLSENNDNVQPTKQGLYLSTFKIDSLLSLYEKTYLVKAEKASLSKFTSLWSCYQEIENRIIIESQSLERGHSKALFKNDATLCFHGMVNSLNQLENIQTTVGKKLKDNSDIQVLGLKQLSYLQMGLLLVIGLIIHFLGTPTRIKHRAEEKYTLN